MKNVGMTLERLSLRLEQDHGVHVSPTTISNWTHGRLPRRTPDDRRRTEGIEQVLRLSRGELHFELERDRLARKLRFRPNAATKGLSDGEEDPVHELRDLMTKVGGSDAYSVIGVEERVLIGADRREYLRTVRLTVLALDGFTDCYRLVYTPDDDGAKSDIVPMDGCRKGREIPGRDGLRGVELVFDRILAAGDSHQFVYQERVQHSGASPQCWTRRGVGHSPVTSFRTVVAFEARPAKVWSCRWDHRGEQPIDQVPVAVVNGTATLDLQHPAPGLHGLVWTW